MKNHRSTIYNNKNSFEPSLTTERTAGSSRTDVILIKKSSLRNLMSISKKRQLVLKVTENCNEMVKPIHDLDLFVLWLFQVSSVSSLHCVKLNINAGKIYCRRAVEVHTASRSALWQFQKHFMNLIKSIVQVISYKYLSID